MISHNTSMRTTSQWRSGAMQQINQRVAFRRWPVHAKPMHVQLLSSSNGHTARALATETLPSSPTSSPAAGTGTSGTSMQSHAAFLVLGATLSSYRSAMRRSVAYTSLVREWAMLTSLMQRVASSLPSNASSLRPQAEALESGLAAVVETTTQQMSCCKDLHSCPTNALAAAAQLHYMYQVLTQLLSRCGASPAHATVAVQQGIVQLLQAEPQYNQHNSHGTAAEGVQHHSSNGTAANASQHHSSNGTAANGWQHHSSTAAAPARPQLDTLIASIGTPDVSVFHQELWAHTVAQVVGSRAWHYTHMLDAARILLTSLASSCALLNHQDQLTCSHTNSDSPASSLLGLARYGVALPVVPDVKAQALAEVDAQLSPSARLVWRRIHHEAFNLAAHKLSILAAATSAPDAKNGIGAEPMALEDFPLLQFLQSVKWESLTAAARAVQQVPVNELPTSKDAHMLEQTQQAARTAVAEAAQRLVGMVQAYNEACKGALLMADSFACSQAWVDAVLSAALCTQRRPAHGADGELPGSLRTGCDVSSLDSCTTKGVDAAARLVHALTQLSGRCSQQAHQALDTLDTVLVSGWEIARAMPAVPVGSLCTEGQGSCETNAASGYWAYSTGGNRNGHGHGSVVIGGNSMKSGSSAAGSGTVQAACPAAAERYLNLVWATDSPAVGLNFEALQGTAPTPSSASSQGVKALFKARCELSKRPPSAALCALVQAEVVAAADANTAQQAAAVAAALELHNQPAADAASKVDAPADSPVHAEDTDDGALDSPTAQQLMVLDAVHMLLAVHVAWMDQQQQQQPDSQHSTSAVPMAAASGLDVDLLLTKLCLCMATLPGSVWVQQDFRRRLYPAIIKLVCGDLAQRPDELLVDHYLHIMHQLLLASIDRSRVPVDSNQVPVMILPDEHPAWASEHVPLTADDLAALVHVASMAPSHMLPNAFHRTLDVAIMQLGEAAQRAHFLRCKSWGNLLSALVDATWLCPHAAIQLLHLGLQAPQLFGPGLELSELVDWLPKLHPDLASTHKATGSSKQPARALSGDWSGLDVSTMYDMLCLRACSSSGQPAAAC